MYRINIFYTFLISCVVGTVALQAQNGLRDIPSTKVEDQIAGFKLPPGAKINLFAAEPMLKKPVHMNWDSQGRLWVVSSPLYPHIEPGQEEIDQVIILEDTNGDGQADSSSVFADNLHIPTAVLPGDGGAYVANSTEMLFLKDTNNDGQADQRKVVLSGFGTEDTHHLIHTFRFGPEGMIWFNQSIYIHSHLETPYGVRRLLGGGMWHYRPETQRTDVFMKGLINPWGHAFDRYSQSFLTDGAGSQGINFVYPRSVFPASPGASRAVSGLNSGQPKLCGAEYLSGSHIPDQLQNSIATADFRGHRVNLYKLSENGTAGYDSTQQQDLVSCTHRAFRPIDVKMGPDGAIYVADWYNPIIQHGEVDFRDERRDHQHGRIWRISFDNRELDQKPDFQNMSDQELAELAGPVGWNSQMATVVLRERGAKAFKGIEAAWSATDNELAKLNLVVATQAINHFQDQWAAELATNAKDPQVRAGALRALYYRAADRTNSREIASKAIADPHPRVRLWGVSILAQLSDSDTVQLGLKALNGIDQPDKFLDFAVWSLCREHAEKWLPIAETKNPFDNARQLLYAMRAVGTNKGSQFVLSSFKKGEFESPGDLADISDWVSRTGDPQALDLIYQKALSPNLAEADRVQLLRALASTAKLRKIKPTQRLDEITQQLESKNPEIFKEAASLAGTWKIDSAKPILETAFLGNNSAKSIAALEGLRLFGGQQTAQFLKNLAKDASQPESQRVRAINGFVRLNPAEAARLAATSLPNFKDTNQAESIFSSFLSNNRATLHLTNALKDVKLPEAIALAGVQKASSAATKPDALIKAIQNAGGLKPMQMSLTAEEMNSMMVAVAEKGDPHRGEIVYRKAGLQCAVCHAIGGAGGIIGPDMVSIGASAPVDYLIESLLEPSKKIKEGYHTTLITMKNGDTFAGAVAREDKTELVIRDAAGKENRLAKNQIKNKIVSPVSLMPPGLTLQLRQDEFVDLIRFLSELGKEGDFKTSATSYLRNWKVLHPHERIRDEIGHYGEKIFGEADPTFQWTPFYANVDGSLPIKEMPDLTGRGRSRYGAIRSHLSASKEATLKLKLDGQIAGVNLFLNEQEIELPTKGESAELSIPVSAGEHRLTISALKINGLEKIRFQLLEAAGIEFTQ